jgi:hypothetical protein
MFHDDKVTLIIIRNAEVVEECIGRLPHDHGAEELPA